MEKILLELMKSEDPHSISTHRRIASLLNTKAAIVATWSKRFKDSLEQIAMVRNQRDRLMNPDTKTMIEQQRRDIECPLPTDEEWREADARSLAAQFGTSEDKPEQGETLEAVFAEVTAMPEIEKARLQEGASARNFIAYQHLANQMRTKYTRP